VVPSPKSHAQDVGLPVDVSVNCTTSGACPVAADAVKDAVASTGAAATVTVVVAGVLVPTALVAVSCTVYVPASV
jgi:hypothetical protein